MDFEQFERICTVVACYYLLPEAAPAPWHFGDWIESLPEPLRAVHREKGYEACRDLVNFRRFVAELNNVGLETYMQDNLSEMDYKRWQQL